MREIRPDPSYLIRFMNQNGSMGKVINSEFERTGGSGTGKRALAPLAGKRALTPFPVW